MLIDFKQRPRVIKFIGLLNFEIFAYCSVHMFDKVIFYYFRCDVTWYPIKNLPYGMFTKQPVCHNYSQSQGATPNHTHSHPKILLEAYDRIPSQRGHATPLVEIFCDWMIPFEMIALICFDLLQFLLLELI